jgi:hypothetical protein
MKARFKAIMLGGPVGAFLGLLWGSGLLGLISMVSGRHPGLNRHWTDDFTREGYLHRLWTYPLYGFVAGLLLFGLFALNKDWGRPNSDPPSDGSSQPKEQTPTAITPPPEEKARRP